MRGAANKSMVFGGRCDGDANDCRCMRCEGMTMRAVGRRRGYARGVEVSRYRQWGYAMCDIDMIRMLAGDRTTTIPRPPSAT